MAADKSPLLRRRPFYQDVTDFVRATQTAAFSDRMEVSSGRPDMASPQAFTSSYATRLREYSNPLLASIFQPAAAQIVSTSRTTKRGTTSINYAEDEHEDDDIEYGDGLRRPTGLRSVRRQSFGPDRAYNQDKQRERPDKPVETLGIWRDWIGKSKLGRTDLQLHAQSILPTVLIPVRIDMEIPSFSPAPAWPLPHGYSKRRDVDPTMPQYTSPAATPPFRLRDAFMYNLFEALTTTDQFALQLVNELDLPNVNVTAAQISAQIRQQLEEYAPVALHPLFRLAQPEIERANGITASERENAATGSANTTNADEATAAATDVGEQVGPKIVDPGVVDFDPDNSFRCVIKLNVTLGDRLYTDQFEWSLLNPHSEAENLAKLTCADMGLGGEWVSALVHAIAEEVLKLKREVCENGGMMPLGSQEGFLTVDGQTIRSFADRASANQWGPKIETLTKDEIEKREAERMRHLRRQRRELGRFSSMAGGLTPQASFTGGAGAFFVGGAGDNGETSESLGRGERSRRKKRKINSMSPPPRAYASGGRDTPDTGNGGQAVYGAGVGTLGDSERQTWRCAHCKTLGTTVWQVRDGPAGPRTLCNNCGYLYTRHKELPPWFKNLHKDDRPLVR